MSEVRAANFLFSWTSGVTAAGAGGTLAYTTSLWLPDIDPPDGGRKIQASTFQTLGGSVLTSMLQRFGRNDHRLPGQFTLAWEVVEEDLYKAAAWDYAQGSYVLVRADHHWRSLWVTLDSPTQITVSPGTLDYQGDTYRAAAATVFSGLGDMETYLMATPNSDGTITFEMEERKRVPETRVTVATIGVAPRTQEKIVHSVGAANARVCRVLDFKPQSWQAGLVGLQMTLQEYR